MITAIMISAAMDRRKDVWASGRVEDRKLSLCTHDIIAWG